MQCKVLYSCGSLLNCPTEQFVLVSYYTVCSLFSILSFQKAVENEGSFDWLQKKEYVVGSKIVVCFFLFLAHYILLSVIELECLWKFSGFLATSVEVK